MRFIPGIIVAFGLGLIGWAGYMFLNLPDADSTSFAEIDSPALEPSYEPQNTIFNVDWAYNDQTGFTGNLAINLQSEIEKAGTNAEIPSSVFPIRYPSEFAGGLSIHRNDQTLAPQDLYDSRQLSGLEYLGCFSMDSGLSLTAERNQQEVYRDYRACRAVSRGEGEPFQAVIGYLHPPRNQQPLTEGAERCAAEAAIWLNQVALPGTEIAICMIVMDEVENSTDLIVFERVGGELIVRSSRSVEIGTTYGADGVGPRDSDNLTRFRYFQAWKENQEKVRSSFYAKLPEIGDLIAARAESVDLSPRFRVEDVVVDEKSIGIHLKSMSDARVGDHNERGARVRTAVFDLLCGDPVTAAFLDLQQLDTVLGVRLVSEDGSPMLSGRHDEMPCNSQRE